MSASGRNAPQAGGQGSAGGKTDRNRLTVTVVHRSNSVGSDERKRKERSSIGAEQDATKRRVSSTAFVVMEAIETTLHQYQLLDRTVRDNKNTHRDVKEAVAKLGRSMEVWSKETTRQWLEEHKWEKADAPTYDVECQTGPKQKMCDASAQTERTKPVKGAKVEESEDNMSEAPDTKARVFWASVEGMLGKTGRTLQVGSAVSLSRSMGVLLDGEAVENSTRTSWYMVAAEKEGGKAEEAGMIECLRALAGKLAEKGLNEVAMVRDSQWEATKRLAKKEEVWGGYLVTGYQDKKATWSQVVTGRTGGRGAEPRERRKEAVIVKASEGGYSQALQRVRDDLAKAKVNVASIRKTRSGDVLVEATGPASGGGQIRAALEGSHKVRAAGERERVPVIIKGLDALGSEEEVTGAVKAILGADALIEVGEMWATFGDTKAVRIRTTPEAAEKLGAAGSVQVGPVRCRVVSTKERTWCYRCWEEGHVAARCTGPDRKGMCFRCGEGGHKAAECREEERCLTCGKKGHRTGASRCNGLKRTDENHDSPNFRVPTAPDGIQ